ncbi:MAG: FMN-binding negative transcriptional regulator, partial [Burkholderiales bacterium]|nr:FMN-binding negative transcriptional regulator [Burkholderiales bacterium]
NVDGDLVGNHLPFMALNENIAIGSKLISHTAKANPIWKIGEKKQKVLLVFSGYETYISPSSYPTKKETHKVVPTYNYLSVHINGTLSAIQDEEDKHHIVKILTEKMESSRKDPWAVTDAPKDYIETMLANIVGVELLVEKIEAKWKVSQNRPARDRQGVIDDLTNNINDSNSIGMAKEIEALGGLNPDHHS